MLHDNGLLKYYKDYADEKGRLKTYQAFGDGEYSTSSLNIKLFYISNGEVAKKYFEKFLIYNTSYGVYSELVQSQVFKDNGLNTAIYTPSITKSGTKCVISDNISTPNNVKMVEFVDKAILKGNIQCSPYSNSTETTPEKIQYEKIFTKSAMKKFILGHALDVAGGNNDRHPQNFEVQVGKTEEGLDIIEDIFYYDYGETTFAYPPKKENSFYFKNGLGYGMNKNKNSMIAMFRNCPHILEYYQPNELAEILGNVDIREIARDFKEEINFSIGEEYLDSAERSYFNVAQGLVKGVREDGIIQDLISGN